MNKNPLFSVRPSPGIRFRNLHAASWNSFSGAIVSLFVITLSPCLAVQNCTLARDTSSDPNVGGYKLRYGTTSGNPSQSIDVGKATSRTVSNLNDATTYYFTVVAYNASGLESQPSNEVSNTTPGLSPSGAFVNGDRVVALQGVAARNIASTGGTILQMHSAGELGTVTGGPTSANGWTWWNINYDTGSDGWSTQEGYLAKATGPQSPGHTLTVVNGTGDGAYATGTFVPVGASVPSGQQFDAWTGDIAILPAEDLHKASTTALMPSLNVSITATFKAASGGNDRIRYYPRANFTYRMVGGVFEGTNGDPDGGPYTTIYTITQDPPLAWSEVNVSLGNYRYLRYRGPSGSHGNVAEIEFYRNGSKETGTGYGTPGSWNGTGATFDEALDGNVNTFFDAPTGDGNYVGIDTGS